MSGKYRAPKEKIKAPASRAAAETKSISNLEEVVETETNPSEFENSELMVVTMEDTIETPRLNKIVRPMTHKTKDTVIAQEIPIRHQKQMIDYTSHKKLSSATPQGEKPGILKRVITWILFFYLPGIAVLINMGWCKEFAIVALLRLGGLILLFGILLIFWETVGFIVPTLLIILSVLVFTAATAVAIVFVLDYWNGTK